ncbi:MAG TPA: PD-(D/E)XK nuclease family protein [Thermoplasmata archaeon]|nr:PD-(D/E)XK nuclease family protein [Thermoplasmata archaeon]
MPAIPALSYSSYRTYQECPLRWKFLYVDKLPEAPRGYFTFGRVVHSVLEELVAPLVVPTARRAGESDRQRTLDEWHARPPGSTPSPRWMTSEEMLAAYDRAWSSEGYLSAEEESRYRALGRELLLRYYDFLVRERPMPVAVEEHLETRWDGIPVHGYIDRIDRTPSGGLEIVDYKTSRELSSEDARESDQLSLYQVLVESNYAEPVHGLTLYHLRSLTPLRTAPRERIALEGLHNRLGTAYDGIRAEAFEPTPGRHCTRCDFRDRCPEFRAVPPLEGERLRALVDRFESLRAEEGRLESELRRTAEELHRAAEELGVHRVPGSRSVAVRHREEAWQYSLDPVRPMLERSGLAGRVATGSPEEVRRLVRDPTVDPELRRKVAETGARRVKWYWELEDGTPES